MHFTLCGSSNHRLRNVEMFRGRTNCATRVPNASSRKSAGLSAFREKSVSFARQQAIPAGISAAQCASSRRHSPNLNPAHSGDASARGTPRRSQKKMRRSNNSEQTEFAAAAVSSAATLSASMAVNAAEQDCSRFKPETFRGGEPSSCTCKGDSGEIDDYDRR